MIGSSSGFLRKELIAGKAGFFMYANAFFLLFAGARPMEHTRVFCKNYAPVRRWKRRTGAAPETRRR
jgi:hypothetical protein